MSITREDLSPARIIADHARLAEALTVRVASLEQARREHGEVGSDVDELASFLDSDLVPYLRAEEDVLYGAPAEAGQADGILGSHSRISRHRRSEHDLLAQAASTLARRRHRPTRSASPTASSRPSAATSRTRTPGLCPWPGRRRARIQTPGGRCRISPTRPRRALSRQDWPPAYRTPSRISTPGSPGRSRHQPREIRDDPSEETAVYERIIAALSRHASVMALYLHPAINDVLPRSDHDVTRQLRTELREAEKTMLRLERILHGDALENPPRFTDLWAAVAQISQTHSSLEEALVR